MGSATPRARLPRRRVAVGGVGCADQTHVVRQVKVPLATHRSAAHSPLDRRCPENPLNRGDHRTMAWWYGPAGPIRTSRGPITGDAAEKNLLMPWRVTSSRADVHGAPGGRSF